MANVKMCSVFDSACAKPSDWHKCKCWWNLSKLTRNEVLETMITGSTSPTHPRSQVGFTQLFSIYLTTHWGQSDMNFSFQLTHFPFTPFKVANSVLSSLTVML